MGGEAGGVRLLLLLSPTARMERVIGIYGLRDLGRGKTGKQNGTGSSTESKTNVS